MPEGTPNDGRPVSRFSSSDFESLIGASLQDVFASAADGNPSEEEKTVNNSDEKRPRLSAVPEPGTPDQRAAVSKWILTLSEALMSTRARESADHAMAAFIAKNSQWAANWFAGYMVDLAKTLPPQDPWRRLSAFIDRKDLSGGQPVVEIDRYLSFRNPLGAEVPSQTGAVRPDGSPFGRTADALDIIVDELGVPDLDVGLTAIAEPIDPVASALVGFAGSNPELMASVLSKVYNDLWTAGAVGDSQQAGSDAFLEVSGTALRWLIHRRRAYTGNDDPFPTVAGFAWMARADRVTAGGRNIASEPSMARGALIDPGAYEQLRLDGP